MQKLTRSRGGQNWELEVEVAARVLWWKRVTGQEKRCGQKPPPLSRRRMYSA